MLDALVAAFAVLETRILDCETLDANVFKLSELFLRFSVHLLADSFDHIVRLVDPSSALGARRTD